MCLPLLPFLIKNQNNLKHLSLLQIKFYKRQISLSCIKRGKDMWGFVCLLSISTGWEIVPLFLSAFSLSICFKSITDTYRNHLYPLYNKMKRFSYFLDCVASNQNYLNSYHKSLIFMYNFIKNMLPEQPKNSQEMYLQQISSDRWTLSFIVVQNCVKNHNLWLSMT